jgi:hypothetical protein
VAIFETSSLNEFLVRSGLIRTGVQVVWTRLAGGVSSDIWRVDLDSRTICVKRALPSLKVEADWRAPVIRNQYEWEWFNFVDREFPQFVPQPIAHDADLQILAMEFLPPDLYPVWKTELLAGRIDPQLAFQVGHQLGMIHSRSAGVEVIKRTFATDSIFYSLRIEPYLIATAERHPDLRKTIVQTADTLGQTHIALVHGDVSPKNILIGPHGPVFLDAECAWYGDPAFDVAFCLNHLLLKCTVLPNSAVTLLACFTQLLDGYFRELDWEPRDEFERRCARLLPMLLLARVDGKSPVEYLVDESLKDLVRVTAKQFIVEPPEQILPIASNWKQALARSA